MRCIAIIMVRNGAAYVNMCLSHLRANGIEVAVIDHGSEDGTYDLCRAFAHDGICHLERVNYPGYFSLMEQLERKQRLIETLATDWIIHQDIDERLENPEPGRSLYEGIEKEDAAGYNAVNFNELVFLPIPSGQDFAKSVHYYFFEPFAPRLMRAWKKSARLSGFDSGGHILQGDIKLAPDNYILRHYPFSSQEHAYEKYRDRPFAQHEVDKGWHKNRIGLAEDRLRFPDPGHLKKLPSWDSRDFDLSEPWTRHYWE